MAFGHGKDTAVYLNGRNMSPYLQKLEVDMSAAAEDSTCFGKSFATIQPGLKSGSISAKGLFDGATSAVDQIFEAARGAATAALWTAWVIGETAVGAIGYAMRARGTQYRTSSPVAGLVASEAAGQADDDLERVKSLHPLAAETAAGNGTTLDDTVQTTTGAAAYLHVTGFTGTSITVVIQDSANGTDWAAVTGLAFTAATAAGTSERVATAATATIRRYVRAVWTGTITSATFSVAFARK